MIIIILCALFGSDLIIANTAILLNRKHTEFIDLTLPDCQNAQVKNTVISCTIDKTPTTITYMYSNLWNIDFAKNLGNGKHDLYCSIKNGMLFNEKNINITNKNNIWTITEA